MTGLLAKINKYNLSKDFLVKLIDFSGGYFSSSQMENLFEIFRKEISRYRHTRDIEKNLTRILASQYDRVSFLKESLVYPFHIEIITAIAASSNYLTDILVRNPGYLFQLYGKEYLQARLADSNIESDLRRGMEKFRSFESKVKYLKNFKRRITLKIGLCDILGIDDFVNITGEISLLAREITAALFSLCYNEVLSKYKIENDKRKYTLAALGKLGGNELNYSSDIDLILFYDENKMVGNAKQFEYHRIITEAAQLFINASSENKGDGYLYRIDFRLRPDGQYSPLCRKMNDYLKYYEVRSENWERQMLIKLDFITGNRALFDSFRQFILPFVYPASFLNSPLEQIRKMKRDIETGSINDHNIKLFHGGIRDIEFSVQALQLLNGGKIHDLRTGNTLDAIVKLQQHNFLSNIEAETLKDAYIFYRKIEHYLQLMNDLQTHSIPSENEQLFKLAHFMKMNSVQEFNKRLNAFRKNVRKIYESITKPAVISNSTSTIPIKKINFIEKERALKNFRYVKSGTGIFEQKEFDKNTNQLFDNFAPWLFHRLKKSGYPDRLLENFTKIIKNINTPSVWYSEFSIKNFFTDFLRICEFSQRAVDELSTNRFSGELLLTRRVFAKNINLLFDELNLSQIVFILTIQFTLRLITRNKFSKILSECIDHNINTVADNFCLPYNYFIAGLGSFGTSEMNFASDIDIIFVAEGISPGSQIQNDFQKLFNKLREELKPFKLDAQLRPDGKSSPLVWDLKNYSGYLSTRAKVWEFQSLLKLRFISGNKIIFKSFKKVVLNSIAKLSRQIISSEIKNMYSKISRQNLSLFTDKIDIKKAGGGTIQINFALDEILLKNVDVAKSCLSKSTEWKIKFLEKHNLLKGKAEEISCNLDSLRNIELAAQNIFHVYNSIVPAEKSSQMLILEFLKRANTKSLTTELNYLLQSNLDIIEKLRE